MKVAIVCDWLTNQGGAERVVLELHKMFPEAPIYTSVFNRKGSGMAAFADADVRTSFIQHWPWAKTKHQLYPVLRRWAFQRFDFSGYDLVISSSGAEAKGINTRSARADDDQLSTDKQLSNNYQQQLAGSIPNTTYDIRNTSDGPLHINYCHSPTHYYWVRPDEYLQTDSMGWFGKLLRFGLRLLIKPMRRWDYLVAQRPDVMIANSSITKDRIKQFYDRESEVIFPPVDIERFTPPADPPKRHGFVVLGRQVHYKRFDLAVEACSRLGVLLRVIGDGPEHEKLRVLAGRSVEFYTDLNDEEVAEALWHAEALISPGVEDFGITAVEALASGTPVIAYRSGGAADIIQLGKTGEFFEEQTVDSLTAALQLFEPSRFNPATLTKAANKFSAQKFRQQIIELINIHKS